MEVILRALRTINLKLLVLPMLVGMSGSLMPMQENVALKAIEQGRKSHDVPSPQPTTNADSASHTVSKDTTSSFHMRINTMPSNFVRDKITTYANQALHIERTRPTIGDINKDKSTALPANTTYVPAQKISEKALQKYEFVKKYIFEPLLGYKGFDALYARLLLMKGELLENGPASQANQKLRQAYNDITRIICHPNGAFKEVGSLSKQDLDAIARIYITPFQLRSAINDISN